jgi:hypothetical protein
MIKTKRSSLVDAQRNAVEKAVGVYVSGKTLVEKAVAIENNILARSEGYVKKYDILSEGPQADLYKTKIRALVALKDLEADLKGMSLLQTPELKRPRLTLTLTEKIDQKESDEHVAANALQKSLMDRGFVVVDTSRAKEADLQVKGQVSALPFQSSGLGGFISYRARLSLQATRTGSNDIVYSLTKEASGLGGSEELAGYKALETVAELAGEEMGAQLPDAFTKGKNLLVMVEGVESFSDVERVRQHLSSQPGVSDLMLRLYDEKMAQFEVQLGNTQPAELAADLEKSQSVHLQVLETAPQTLRLKLN